MKALFDHISWYKKEGRRVGAGTDNTPTPLPNNKKIYIFLFYPKFAYFFYYYFFLIEHFIAHSPLSSYALNL